MPRYYFHVRKNGILDRDFEGSDLPSDESAYEEAILGAREILANKVRNGEVIDGDAFEVTRSDGRIVRTIPFKDALRLD